MTAVIMEYKIPFVTLNKKFCVISPRKARGQSIFSHAELIAHFAIINAGVECAECA